MATNESDDGSAPVDFNLSSTTNESESKNNVAREKCLLCSNLRKTFYCKVCVCNGDFVSSSPQNPGNFFGFLFLIYSCRVLLILLLLCINKF